MTLTGEVRLLWSVEKKEQNQCRLLQIISVMLNRPLFRW